MHDPETLRLVLMVLMLMPFAALAAFIGIPLIRALASAREVQRPITRRR